VPFITNSIWSHPRLNPGLYGEKPASSHLRYDMALT
jgi:hypothetical protein